MKNTLFTPIMQTLLACLLPKICLLCRTSTSELSHLCTLCQPLLPWLPDNICQQCAHPLPLTRQKLTHCGSCLKKPPPYTITVACFSYQQPIRNMLNSLKFNQKLVYAKPLAYLLYLTILKAYKRHHSPLPTCIIPIPLHKKRLRQRGYNQSLEIARVIKPHLNILIDTHSCQRMQYTLPQTQLEAKDRKKNVQQAFVIQSVLNQHQHIALLDDVVTTGQTATSLAQSIKKQHPEARIDLWCCARTIQVG